MAEVVSGNIVSIVLDDTEATALRDVLQTIESQVGLPAELDELADAIGVEFPRAMPIQKRADYYKEVE